LGERPQIRKSNQCGKRMEGVAANQEIARIWVTHLAHMFE